MFRDKTADFGTNAGFKVGDTITVRTNSDFEVNEFTDTGPIVEQEVRQSSKSFTVDKHFDVSVKVTAKQRALNLDDLSREVLQPAMVRLAEKVDNYLLSKIVYARSLYSSATLFETAADIAQGRRVANKANVDKANRFCLVNDDLEATLLGIETFTKFDNRGQPGVSALQEASLGRLMGMDFFSTENMPILGNTNGDGAGVTNNTGGTTNMIGTSVITSTATSGQFEMGDKIHIAGARRSYTVSAMVPAASTSIPVMEQIDEIIPDGAAITTVGSASTAVDYQGVIFNPEAFAMAMPPLDQPASEASSVVSHEGLSIRFVESWIPREKINLWSFDLLVGGVAYDGRKATLLGKE